MTKEIYEGTLQIHPSKHRVGDSMLPCISAFEIVDENANCDFRLEDLIKLDGRKVKIIVEDEE